MYCFPSRPTCNSGRWETFLCLALQLYQLSVKLEVKCDEPLKCINWHVCGFLQHLLLQAATYRCAWCLWSYGFHLLHNFRSVLMSCMLFHWHYYIVSLWLMYYRQYCKSSRTCSQRDVLLELLSLYIRSAQIAEWNEAANVYSCVAHACGGTILVCMVSRTLGGVVVDGG